MNSRIAKLLAAVIASAVFLMGSSCSGRNYLRTAPVYDQKEIAGNFTLILFGTADNDGLEAVAFLDAVADDYEVVPYAPEFQYSIKRNIEGKEAVEMAIHYLGSHNAYKSHQIRRILEKNTSRTIGYEVRPLYLPFVYGHMDVLDIHYWHSENKTVHVTIRLLPSVEKRLLGDDGSPRTE